MEPWVCGNEAVLKDWRSVPAKMPRAMVFLRPRPWMRRDNFLLFLVPCVGFDDIPLLGLWSGCWKDKVWRRANSFLKKIPFAAWLCWCLTRPISHSTVNTACAIWKAYRSRWFGGCKDEFWCGCAMIRQLWGRERDKSIPIFGKIVYHLEFRRLLDRWDFWGEIYSFHAGEASQVSCTSGCGAWYCTEAAWQRWYADP